MDIDSAKWTGKGEIAHPRPHAALRLSLAVLLAPFLGWMLGWASLILGLAFFNEIRDGTGSGEGFLLAAVIGAPFHALGRHIYSVMFCGVVTIGLPFHFIMARLGRTSFWLYLIAGAILGPLYFSALGLVWDDGLLDVYDQSALLLSPFGAATALCFRLIAGPPQLRAPSRPNHVEK